MKRYLLLYPVLFLLFSCINTNTPENKVNDENIQNTYTVKYRAVSDSIARIDTLVYQNQDGKSDTIFTPETPWEKIIHLNPDSADYLFIQAFGQIQQGRVAVYLNGANSNNEFDKEDAHTYYSPDGIEQHFAIEAKTNTSTK